MHSPESVPFLRRPDYAQEVKDAAFFRHGVEEIIKKGREIAHPHKHIKLPNLLQRHKTQSTVETPQELRDLWTDKPRGERVAFSTKKIDSALVPPHLREALERTLTAPLENLLLVVDRKREVSMQLASISVYKPTEDGLGPSVVAHSYDGILKFTAANHDVIWQDEKFAFCRELVNFTNYQLANSVQEARLQ